MNLVYFVQRPCKFKGYWRLVPIYGRADVSTRTAVMAGLVARGYIVCDVVS